MTGEQANTRLQAIASSGTDLLRNGANPAVVAAPMLHFRNAHPNSLKLYADVLRSRFTGSLARAFLPMAYHNLLRPLVGGKGSRLQSGDQLPERTDILFVSHLLDVRRMTQCDDIYIGDLAERLQRHGISSVNALIDHTQSSSAHISQNWSRSQTPRVVLPRQLDIVNELQISAQLGRAALSLAKKSISGNIELARFAALDALSPTARDAMRIAYQIGELVKRLNPKIVMTTLEGHSWERLAFHAAHEADPATVCIGYAHAPLFPMHHALTAQLGNGYDPDVIMVPGDVSLSVLKNNPTMLGKDIRVLGSVRSFAKGEEFPKMPTSRVCLLLPEGLNDEVAALIRLSLEAGAKCPDVRFRIRLHPAMSKDLFFRQRPEFANLPPTFEWSKERSLNADLAEANWALYRGSTAIISAPLLRTKPLHYRVPGELADIDPLFALEGYRESVDCPEQLIRILSTEHVGSEAELSAAIDFCTKFYVPLREQVFVDLMRGLKSDF
ncbi:hypothetical protein Rleg4DRAFT_4410 [Rhizobium leguminosarum bv. trifolii WSM2297]|uniref:Glycosyl/glycerophosphate transferase, teichoic acid biosynthesis n=2 Tax=Rhizobium leguminosarum TaxID=384 RepID=J0CSE0_RHILT|nr:hypothetical protein Rleg4DRAFT_4410 [Rhizobium leguminosarum bv. trifolii WSM2297]